MTSRAIATRRYVAVGLVNTAVDIALFSALALLVGLAPVVANVASTAAVMTLSFFVNRAWVFGSTARGVGAFAQFVTVTLFSALVVQSLVIVGVIALCESIQPDLADSVVTPGAKVVAIGAGMVFNFLGYRWVFGQDR